MADLPNFTTRPVEPQIQEVLRAALPIRLGGVYVVIGWDDRAMQVVAYAGSSKEVIDRLRASKHPMETFLNRPETRIYGLRVYGNLNVEATKRKTEASASRQALGAAEEPFIADIRRMVAAIADNREPAPGATKDLETVRQGLLETKAVGAAIAAAKGDATAAAWLRARNRISSSAHMEEYLARHGVSVPEGIRMLKGPGIELGSTAFGLANVLGLVSMYRDVNMARQGYVSVQVPMVCEDAYGTFVFVAHPHGLFEVGETVYFSWLRPDTYTKRYIVNGTSYWRETSSSREEYQDYVDEYERLYGHPDFFGNFVPGLLAQEPPKTDIPPWYWLPSQSVDLGPA